MRLHRPVHLHRQPHLGIPEPHQGPQPMWGPEGHYKGTVGMFQGGVTPPAQANGQVPMNAMASAGAGFARGGPVRMRYDAGGPTYGPATGGGDYSAPTDATLNPNQFTQDPTITDPTGSGSYSGGYSNNNGVSDPATQGLVANAGQVYTSMTQQVQNAVAQEQAAMQGGSSMAGPGPAGPGVTPQSPSGNPGRPGWTDPNQNAANDKNFYQNVTSNPATSPSRGTSYQNPTPIGGQRGQEDYSKTPGSSNVWPTPTPDEVEQGAG